MNGLKGVTAREANCILHNRGQHFWQDESFDHWVRTSAEFDRIQAYIERNPVSAQLVSKPEEWPWSSAARIAPTPFPYASTDAFATRPILAVLSLAKLAYTCRL
jgi:hypothetical protein